MPDAVKSIVDGVVEGRILSVFGESRINVLMLNLALDVALGPPRVAEP
jgi:K+-transporting ATPase c subunit